MDVNWINVAVAIGGLIVLGIVGDYYSSKYKRLQEGYNKRCEELTNALGEVGRAKSCNEGALSEIKLLNKAIQDRDKVLYYGRNNLTWMEQLPSFSSGSSEGSIMVIGQDKESGFYFIVKVFQYDINDPSDREFAIREAEELIETIKKA